MTIPKLWRASDDYLISDSFVDFDRWQEATGIQQNELLIGGIWHEEQLGNENNDTTVRCKFADYLPNSTLTNLLVLKACRRNLEPVTFLDFYGDTWTCTITTDINVEAAPSRLIPRDYASFDLRRGTPIP